MRVNPTRIDIYNSVWFGSGKKKGKNEASELDQVSVFSNRRTQTEPGVSKNYIKLIDIMTYV